MRYVIIILSIVVVLLLYLLFQQHHPDRVTVQFEKTAILIEFTIRLPAGTEESGMTIIFCAKYHAAEDEEILRQLKSIEKV